MTTAEALQILRDELPRMHAAHSHRAWLVGFMRGVLEQIARKADVPDADDVLYEIRRLALGALAESQADREEAQRDG